MPPRRIGSIQGDFHPLLQEPTGPCHGHIMPKGNAKLLEGTLFPQPAPLPPAAQNQPLHPSIRPPGHHNATQQAKTE